MGSGVAVDTGFQPSLAFVRRVSPAESRAGGQAGGTGWLGQVVRGYLAHHAVPTNSQAITSFVHYATWHWKRALGRRRQKGHVTWARIAPIAAQWLPSARVQRPYPQQRLIVKHPRWERSALEAHARICPAGAG